jgi:hypothetical protein
VDQRKGTRATGLSAIGLGPADAATLKRLRVDELDVGTLWVGSLEVEEQS